MIECRISLFWLRVVMLLLELADLIDFQVIERFKFRNGSSEISVQAKAFSLP